ncbi:unnamed protein product [Calypogeia fissa]
MLMFCTPLPSTAAAAFETATFASSSIGLAKIESIFILSEDPLGALTNGVGPSGSGGGPGNQMAQQNNAQEQEVVQPSTKPATAPSRYESQKRRDWNTFGQYLKNHRPPLALARCSGAHVLEFLRYLDQFGKTKVHVLSCHFFGLPNPPHPCQCPLKQAWGSLDALIGRLRAAFEENGGKPESNPFGARVVRMYLREVRESQAKARGIAYEKKKRKRPLPTGGASTSNDQQQQQVQQQQQQQQGLPQGHSQTNPLTGHGYAQQHSQHSQHPQQQQHSQQQQQQQQSQSSQHSQQHSSQQNHSPVSHPLNSYAPNSNPLVTPFSSQQLHTSNLLHSYTPSSNPLNPYSQPNTINAYQDLQLHNHTAGPMIS